MAFKSPTLILLHIRDHLSHWLNSITSCGGTVQKLSPFTPVYCYHSVVACFFSVYQVMKISIKSHHFEGMKCGEMCSRMYFPLQLKYAGLNFFSFFFFFTFLLYCKKNPLFIGEISCLHNVSRNSIPGDANVYYL